VDLRFSDEDEAFRAEARDFLETHLAADFAAVRGLGGPGKEHQDFEGRLEWEKLLGREGWSVVGWPKEHGGKGLPVTQQVIWHQEYARAKAPGRVGIVGEGLLGPTLIAFGSDEQKARFLPGIASGEVLWCQGYSEPNAGSDLANVQTKAHLDGDEWVISGQKVWTTQAQYADYCFLLARTNPDATKHKGISYLLVPMKQDGIEVRGITQPDGTAEFNEVFFDGARCPVDNVVGGIDNGWVVANTTLSHERGMSATTGYRRFAQELDLMVAEAKRNGRIDDPVVRQGLARYHTKIQILRINGLRSLTATVHERKDPAVAALGATNKMFWSEMHREAMELALDIFGAASMLADVEPQGGGWPAVARAQAKAVPYATSQMVSAFFFSRSETIWGGTAEIQRNIVGERVLGLPREPKPPTS
jgi:alkylation response protein AidB-like acyl-CoA dehydrogenase